MPTYDASSLTDAALSHKKPITMQQGRALRDNPLAIAEGASGAPRIEDAALGGTSATSTGKSWIQARYALSNFGEVGTYVFAYSSAGDTSPNGTVAGSTLFAVSAAREVFGDIDPALDFVPWTALSGTWRAMGNFDTVDEQGSPTVTSRIRGATLWLRIS